MSETEEKLREQLEKERQRRVQTDLQRILERRGTKPQLAELVARGLASRATFTSEGEVTAGEKVGEAALEAMADEAGGEKQTHDPTRADYDPVAAGKADAARQRPDPTLAFR